MSMCITWFLQITSRKLFKKSFLGRSHLGTLGAKTCQWRPGHVPYLSYPRYATDVILEWPIILPNSIYIW